jgi:KaiC/GvpD/RAD55 family RecA-like ATPase
MVKAIQKENGFTHKFVPLYVKQRLEQRMSGQYRIAVTGEIGAGKSYVSNQFVELGKQRGIDVHNIELDHVAHSILGSLQEPGYVTVRAKIADTFGDHVQQDDGFIDRKALGDIIIDLEDVEGDVPVRLHNYVLDYKGCKDTSQVSLEDACVQSQPNVITYHC